MIKFIVKRLFYGFLVLLGVITVVFLLFNVLPGDPARMMLGQRADQASIDAINKDLGRDKPMATQFLMYLNDLSPLSVHDPVDKEHYLFLSPEKYSSYVKLFPLGSKVMVLKYPYLRRSYITKRKVSDIVIETLPETAILAFSSQFYDPFSTEPDTEISGKDFIDFLLGRAMEMGRPLGVQYAEGFTSPRLPGVTNLFNLL